MRFALIGYGAWGRQHVHSITSLPGLSLTAIACASAESATAARAAHPDALVTRDWREAVASPDVDIVDVVTPNAMHAQVAIAALEAGKDVLLEKPMATSRADCDALLDAERRTGRLVSIGHEMRQSLQWGKAKSLIDEGAIGDPLFMNVNLFRNFYRSGASGWRYDKARVGSWLLEEMVHHFDLALWYFARLGDPVALRAHGNRRAGRDAGLFDNVSILFRYANGAYVTINQCVAGFEHSLVVEIAGMDGAIRTHWSGTMDRDASAEFRYDRFLTRTVFANGTALFTNDKFRDLDLRSNLGLGLGVQLADNLRAKVQIEGGYGYVSERYASSLEPDRNYSALREATNMELYFVSKRVVVFHRSDNFLSFSDDTQTQLGTTAVRNVNVQMHNGVRIGLGLGLVMTLQYDLDYVRSPAAGRKTTDRRTGLTFGYRF